MAAVDTLMDDFENAGEPCNELCDGVAAFVEVEYLDVLGLDSLSVEDTCGFVLEGDMVRVGIVFVGVFVTTFSIEDIDKVKRDLAVVDVFGVVLDFAVVEVDGVVLDLAVMDVFGVLLD